MGSESLWTAKIDYLVEAENTYLWQPGELERKKREPGIVDKILEFHFVIKHLK